MNLGKLIEKLNAVLGHDPMFEVSAVSDGEHPIGKLVLLSGEVGGCSSDDDELQKLGLRKDEAGDYWFLDLQGTD